MSGITAQESALRLQQIRSRVLEERGVDSLLLIAGADGSEAVDATACLSYLLKGGSGKDLSSRIVLEEDEDEIVILITPAVVHIFCNPTMVEKYEHITTLWGQIVWHVPGEKEMNDMDEYEKYKISAFVSIMSSIQTGDGQEKGALPSVAFFDAEMGVESFPLIQSYALEGYGAGVFFSSAFSTVAASFRDIATEVDARAFRQCYQLYLPQFTRLFGRFQLEVDLAVSPKGTISSAHISRPLMEFYEHGSLRKEKDDAGDIILPHANVVFSESADRQPLYAVAIARHPTAPLLSARTLFFDESGKEGESEKRKGVYSQLEEACATAMSKLVEGSDQDDINEYLSCHYDGVTSHIYSVNAVGGVSHLHSQPTDSFAYYIECLWQEGSNIEMRYGDTFFFASSASSSPSPSIVNITSQLMAGVQAWPTPDSCANNDSTFGHVTEAEGFIPSTTVQVEGKEGELYMPLIDRDGTIAWVQAYFSEKAFGYRSTRKGFCRYSSDSISSLSFGSAEDYVGSEHQHNIYLLRIDLDEPSSDGGDTLIFAVEGASDVKRYLLRDVIASHQYRAKQRRPEDEGESRVPKSHLPSLHALFQHVLKHHTVTPSQFVGNEGEWDFAPPSSTSAAYSATYSAMIQSKVRSEERVEEGEEEESDVVNVTLCVAGANSGGHEVMEKCVSVNRQEKALHVAVTGEGEEGMAMLDGKISAALAEGGAVRRLVITVPWYLPFGDVFELVSAKRHLHIDGVSVVFDPRFAFAGDDLNTMADYMQALLTPGTAQVVCIAEEATAGKMFDKVAARLRRRLPSLLCVKAVERVVLSSVHSSLLLRGSTDADSSSFLSAAAVAARSYSHFPFLPLPSFTRITLPCALNEGAVTAKLVEYLQAHTNVVVEGVFASSLPTSLEFGRRLLLRASPSGIEAVEVKAGSWQAEMEEEREKGYFVFKSISAVAGVDSSKAELVSLVQDMVSQEELQQQLMTRADLTKDVVDAVNDEIKNEELPDGWFFTGRHYVDMDGKSSFVHPEIEVHLDRLLKEQNEEATVFNAKHAQAFAEVEKRKQAVFDANMA
eukprot:CAMPEP_0113898680 /NCGR_PEP_ID=MMETSP0780_2-20120614/19552_1 /TAXON_ID=652834 /ORGANISM="Palpitomonas bilix" /LENGTH=1059 /DNA_ID=CAMNT_0000890647 /DNA_START=53 /DNA_END=3232 /DNA_ORIENTATION=- /assembly_acc=CAM_ASM_000599